MSVIWGLLHLDGRPVEADVLAAMGAPLRPYGPDGGGTWIEGAVGLGQRLLAFTPEDDFERQPLRSADGRFTLVCDARLDNRAELAEALGLKAADASGMPDSAFILAAFERWDLAALPKLIGPAAIALWDGRERRLVLASTPMGERPLLYHAAPTFVAFATRPKALFAAPGVPRAIDLRLLADYLTVAPRARDATLYQDVLRLPLGHALITDARGVRRECFWQPDVHHELRLRRDEDYVEAFESIFGRAVAAQLRSARPVGVMMSGGFDSTSVAAVAARIQRRRGLRLPTFTEVPRPGFDGALAPSRYADETPFVTAMARRYDNLVPTFVRTDGQCYVDGLDEFFEWAEMPFTNASNRPWMEAIARRAHDAGVGALLTGAMGNLTISWTGQTLLPALLRRGQWRQAWREARGRPARLVREGLVPLLPEALYCYLRGLRDHEPWTAEPWLAFSPILPEFAREQEVGPRAAAQGKHFAFQPPAASRQARIDTVYATAFGRIVRTAQVARFGVDSRDATGDRRVFEFCLALPESQFQRDGARRWLLRRAMAHRLPAEILNNPRRGLQAADWFERLVAAQPALLAAVTDAECSELARAVIDLPRLRRLTEALPTAHGSAWVLQREYRGVYETGLSTALFLRWFEASRI